jgi:hypothetical protein
MGVFWSLTPDPSPKEMGRRMGMKTGKSVVFFATDCSD